MNFHIYLFSSVDVDIFGCRLVWKIVEPVKIMNQFNIEYLNQMVKLQN